MVDKIKAQFQKCIWIEFSQLIILAVVKAIAGLNCWYNQETEKHNFFIARWQSKKINFKNYTYSDTIVVDIVPGHLSILTQNACQGNRGVFLQPLAMEHTTSTT